ncbi:precorrin-3B C(17)-methyltransferase [Amycolatopsis sp. NPDC004079]|uniref:SecDF P1 head subdomain-containing protein n=1 Tax=Amycolatopsis sp. NPDC004079 TaxID=3154549 RepID=UPI00339F13F1
MPERRARQRISRLAVLGIALLALAGCGSGPQPVDEAGASSSAGARSFIDLVRAAGLEKGLRFRPVLASAENAATDPPSSERDRQSTDPAVQQRTLESFDCGLGRPDPLTGEDDPALPLVTCGRSSGTRYLLGPAELDGSAVKSAGLSDAPGNAVFTVRMTFTPEASAKWAELTAKNVGKSIAIVVGTRVLVAPAIVAAIPDGKAEITGLTDQSEAEDLADWLNGH